MERKGEKEKRKAGLGTKGEVGADNMNKKKKKRCDEYADVENIRKKKKKEIVDIWDWVEKGIAGKSEY